jgi:hypothetical protein
MEAVSWRELGAVTLEKAAQILGGISESTVNDMIRAGRLRRVPAGRRILVSVHSLRAYLGEVAPGPALSAAEPALVPPPAPPVRPQAPLSARSRRVLAEARRRLG